MPKSGGCTPTGAKSRSGVASRTARTRKASSVAALSPSMRFRGCRSISTNCLYWRCSEGELPMAVSVATYERLVLEDPEGRWEYWCGRPRRKPDMTANHEHL